MSLRLYQQDVLDLIRAEIRKGNKKILVFAPTGFGKTILSKQIVTNAVSKNNKVLFTNHRITLSDQSFSVFEDLNPNLIQGENIIDNGSLITVATIQSFESKEIKEKYNIIIIDEVHYAYESKLITNILANNSNAIIIGLSATPFDNDGYILSGFNSIIDKYQTKDLIDLGFLTPFKCFAPTNMSLVEDVDIEINSIITSYFNYAPGKKFIVFAKSIEHCYQIKEQFKFFNIITEVVEQSVNSISRKKILSDLKDGNIHGVISVEILTTGFDEPTIECVIMANLATSIKKYIQCAGRGIRINEGKNECVFLDLYGNIELHGMPDEKLIVKKRTTISKVIDRLMNLDEVSIESENKVQSIKESKLVYLKKISSLLDLYDGKVYLKESELQEDVNTFLNRTGFFNWRQNSGKSNMGGRWVHFTSKNGLPDNTLIFDECSLYVGIELKLPYGSLTAGQKKTFPEMTENKVLYFIAESIIDVYHIIEHIDKNVIKTAESTTILKSIYELDQRQTYLRNKLKLPFYK